MWTPLQISGFKQLHTTLRSPLAMPGVKGNLNFTEYNDILDDSVLSTWEVPSIWEGPFLFKHDNAPFHKARSIQKWFGEIGVEELD